MLDYISGNKFEELFNTINSNVVIDKNSLKLNIRPFNRLNKKVLFDSTSRYIRAFNIANQNRHIKYILITHCSDNPVTLEMYRSRPRNIIYWYAQNCEYRDSNLIPIPIGLQNEYGYNSGPMGALVSYYKKNVDIWRKNEKNIDTIYCNWNIPSNPDARTNIISSLNKDLKYLEENTTDHTYSLSKEQYWDRLSHFKFFISPPGNNRGGAISCDCHRTWEILYMGGIPIVLKGCMYEEWNELPIIQVNNWSEITYDLLNSYLNKEFNTEKMYMSYWKKRIIEQLDNL